jgi:transcriptional regulator with XRE-family HTH domain
MSAVKLPAMIKERIQERLDALGLKAQAASLKAGLSGDAIRNILRGGSRSPRGITLSRIAAVLECQPGYLTGETDQITATPPPPAGPGHEALKDTAAKAIRWIVERKGVPVTEAELAELQVEYMSSRFGRDPDEQATPQQTPPHPRKPK